jgi:hypothetical protein
MTMLFKKKRVFISYLKYNLRKIYWCGLEEDFLLFFLEEEERSMF